MNIIRGILKSSFSVLYSQWLKRDPTSMSRKHEASLYCMQLFTYGSNRPFGNRLISAALGTVSDDTSITPLFRNSAKYVDMIWFLYRQRRIRVSWKTPKHHLRDTLKHCSVQTIIEAMNQLLIYLFDFNFLREIKVSGSVSTLTHVSVNIVVCVKINISIEEVEISTAVFKLVFKHRKI